MEYEHKPLTFKAINRNPDSFYRHVYRVQTLPQDQLLSLDGIDQQRKIIMIDSCGWYYRQFWPDHNIVSVEGIHMVKNISLDKSKFDKLFDDQDIENPKFSSMIDPTALVIIDHSTVLKYRTTSKLKSILEQITEKTQAQEIWVRQSMITTDDRRFDDRVIQMASVVPENYVTVHFFVDLQSQDKVFVAKYVRKKIYQEHIN